MADFPLGTPECPINVFLRLEESVLVQELRSQVAILTAKNEDLSKQLQQLNFRYGCEVNLCNELVDLLRENRIPYRETIDRWIKSRTS